MLKELLNEIKQNEDEWVIHYDKVRNRNGTIVLMYLNGGLFKPFSMCLYRPTFIKFTPWQSFKLHRNLLKFKRNKTWGHVQFLAQREGDDQRDVDDRPRAQRADNSFYDSFYTRGAFTTPSGEIEI